MLQTQKPPCKISGWEVDGWYAVFGYNPNGRSEFATAAMNPYKASSAAIAARIAWTDAEKYFPSQHGWGDERDAYRHISWSYNLTKMIGPAGAKLITDAHERDGSPGHGDRLMDLFNNQLGRDLANINMGMNPSDFIYNLVKSGKSVNGVIEVCK